MGFRFRRSIKLFPGVRLNVSKSGVSTSIGVPGAHVNVGAKGTRTTVGIPGTGISYSEKISSSHRDEPASNPEDGKNYWTGVLFLVALFAIAWVISKL
jgi:hypothetical protein